MCSWRIFKDTSSENFVICVEKYPWWSSMLGKFQCVETHFFSNELLCQIYFLGMYEIFKINNSWNMDFSWQLEYGYGPLQIYFMDDC